MRKDNVLVKHYSFSKEEKEKLENIQIGIINAQATMEGLQIYKNVLLESVYKRCGIAGDPRKGFNKSIQYNLGENVIIYTEEPIEATEIKKKIIGLKTAH